MSRLLCVFALLVGHLVLCSNVSTSFESEPDVSALIESLRNGSKDERFTAADVLKRRQDVAAVAPLRTIFLEPKEVADVRLLALETWLAIGDEPAVMVSSLEDAARLRSNSLLVRVAALQSLLVPIRDGEGIRIKTILLAIVRDTNEAPELRYNAAAILCGQPKLHSEAVFRSLFEVLFDLTNDAELRIGLVKSLGMTKPRGEFADEIGAALLHVADTAAESVRMRVDSIEALYSSVYLGRETSKTQKNAARLGLKLLVSSDVHRSIRAAAGDLLIHFRGAGNEAVPQLIDILNSRETFLHECTAELLGQIGREAKNAIPALTRLSGDSDTTDTIRAAATAALTKIRK